jgi:hypothetical protein
MRPSSASTSRNSGVGRIYLITTSDTKISMNLKKKLMIADEDYKCRLKLMLKLQN